MGNQTIFSCSGGITKKGMCSPFLAKWSMFWNLFEFLKWTNVLARSSVCFSFRKRWIALGNLDLNWDVWAEMCHLETIQIIFRRLMARLKVTDCRHHWNSRTNQNNLTFEVMTVSGRVRLGLTCFSSGWSWPETELKFSQLQHKLDPILNFRFRVQLEGEVVWTWPEPVSVTQKFWRDLSKISSSGPPKIEIQAQIKFYLRFRTTGWTRNRKFRFRPTSGRTWRFSSDLGQDPDLGFDLK